MTTVHICFTKYGKNIRLYCTHRYSKAAYSYLDGLPSSVCMVIIRSSPSSRKVIKFYSEYKKMKGYSYKYTALFTAHMIYRTQHIPHTLSHLFGQLSPNGTNNAFDRKEILSKDTSKAKSLESTQGLEPSTRLF